VTDVLVIGGGVIGCAVARSLAVRGAVVTLVDPREIGHGASRASAGMLAPFTEGQHDSVLQSLGLRSLDLYDRLVQSLESEGAAIPYTRSGSIEVACDRAASAVLDRTAAALAAAGAGHERLGLDALRAREPALGPDARDGLRIATHGAVDVPALVEALWRSAATRGATSVLARVTRVRAAPDGAQVETSAGPMTARHVVLAAGSWASRIALDGDAPVTVRPVRGQLLALRLPRQVLRHAVWGPRCYLVPWDDGRVLVGATVEEVGFDERATAAGVQSLLQASAALVPVLSEATFVEVRVGLRPATADDRPVVGRSDANSALIYATGHYRNGALLAPLTAEAVADTVEGAPLDDVWSPCRPGRFAASS
jgi:glycine oxidase